MKEFDRMQSGFLRNSISSYLSFGVNLLLRLFLYRTVLSQLGVELFGVWGILKGAILLPSFFQQAINNALFLRASRNTEERARLGAAIGVTVILSGVISIPAVLFARDLVEFLRVPSIHQQTAIDGITILALVFLLDSVSQIFLYLLQGIGRFDLSAVLSSSASLINSLWALVLLKQGYQILGLMMVDLMTSFLLVVAGLVAIRKQIPDVVSQMKLKLDEIIALFRESFSQLLFAFSGRVLWDLDTYLVPRFFSVTGVTPYWVGRRLPYTWMNFMWAGGLPAVQEGSDTHPETMRKISKIYLLQISLAIPAAAFLWTYSDWIIKVWMGNSLDPAGSILRILAVAAAIDFLPSIFVYHLLASGKVNRLIAITSFSAIVKICLAALALMKGDLVWLMYSTAAGAICFSILAYLLVWNETRIPIGRLLGPVVPSLLASLAMIAIFRWFPTPDSALSLLMTAFLFLAAAYSFTYAILRYFRFAPNPV